MIIHIEDFAGSTEILAHAQIHEHQRLPGSLNGYVATMHGRDILIIWDAATGTSVITEQEPGTPSSVHNQARLNAARSGRSRENG